MDNTEAVSMVNGIEHLFISTSTLISLCLLRASLQIVILDSLPQRYPLQLRTQELSLVLRVSCREA